MNEFLAPTALLDHTSAELVKKREFLLTHITKPKDKIKKLYTFVRSLPLCYSKNDDQAASKTFAEGCGQCNTKTILLAALSRGAGVPTRLHAYRLSKSAQRGRIPGWLLTVAPDTTVFLWPEFYVNASWLPLQKIVQVEECEHSSCPFDGAHCQSMPLKQEWIRHDDGSFASPDAYFKKHKPTVHGWRAVGWHLVGRRVLNRRLRTK